MDLNTLLTLTMAQITEFMDAERSTLFLYDEERGELWSRVAQGDEVSEIRRSADAGIVGTVMQTGDVMNLQETDQDPRFNYEQEYAEWLDVLPEHPPKPHETVSEIRLKADQGIAGVVMQTGKSLNIPDAYQDPRFNKSIDEETGFRTRNILCMPLVDADGKRIGVVQVLNKHHNHFTEKDEKLLQALGLQVAIAVENAQLYENLSELRRTENELNEALREQHRHLQDAYRQIEGTNEELKTTLKKFKMVRRLSLLFFIGLSTLIGLYLGSGSTLLQELEEPRALRNAETQGGEFFTVEPEEVTASVTLSGHIQPLEVLNLVSPMNGKVKSRHFNYGAYVQKGELLLRMDTAEEEIRYRNIKADYIRAQQRLAILEDWENSSDVAGARRALSRAKLEMDALQRQKQENRRLLDMGIIPASEYQTSEQAYANQRLDYLAAQDALQLILSQGGEAQQAIARLELENAQLALRDVETTLQQADIRAPVSGVVMLPAIEKDKKSVEIDVGSSVELGEALFAIGNMEGISVECKVDEVEVRKLNIGQTVRITGDAFPGHELRGTLDKIASQADTGQGKVPYFTVTTIVPKLSEAARQNLRLGMSAQAEITVYRNRNAFLIPFEALRREGDSWWVTVRNRDTGYLRSVEVSIGVTTLESVEITQGLGEGYEVLLPLGMGR